MGHEGKKYYEILDMDPQQRRCDRIVKTREYPRIEAMAYDMLTPQLLKSGPWKTYWIDLALLTICGKVRSLRE
ncbi:hypothetical protein SS1G_05944 [Sclerotinia sclerotiorum 1980 UF-70]|uniref:Uncharacterized protein n=1 Tax=Sclerotinia sclerotiorum (strain ATCC 18683 / 1980 / Ss-1) TaxID=665079 RepID=A7EKU7_SCLS1|nr:hypothetical protein SS1G_05944 [Sclerotinia sclerotiorum 1980 UF-70]EDO03463.1 hypothetical protein SS1G_05944 [Sclerotinia sclerotiorum 1980 UF-70]